MIGSYAAPRGARLYYDAGVERCVRGTVMPRDRIGGLTWTCLVGLLALAGCESFDTPPPEAAPPPRSPVADDLLRAGTVAAETVSANLDVQPLRGFGLVVGLNGRGSGDCPTVIRDYLIDIMTRELGTKGAEERKRLPSPGELIDSLDTAAVEVVGSVPAGTRRGAHFDVEVRALPGTATQSLEGGLLLPTALRYFTVGTSGKGLVEGAALAEAGGPLFTNPLPEAGSGAKIDPRKALILGGGRAHEERPIKLMLLKPNYQLAQRIEHRVNECFGQKPKSAEATSAGFVELHTPPALARQSARFREVVGQLYLDSRPAIAAEKLNELVRQAAAGTDHLERIASTWEGLGRSALPSIQPLYINPEPATSFYAARTGLRLGDLTAIPVLGGIATAGTQELRILAAGELGNCDSPQAGLQLAPLLSDPSPAVRIAAYEAIIQRSHQSVRSVTFRHILDQGQINFILDVVDAQGPPLIYARRTRLPRLAVFGARMPITPPVFYVQSDESVTVHTVDGSDDLQVFAKQRGRMSEQLELPLRVVDLVTALAELPTRDEAGHLRGLGLPYSRVLQILVTLSEDHSIPAEVVLEDVGPIRSLVPEVAPERPISEPEEDSK
jgi:hypothetical protein